MIFWSQFFKELRLIYVKASMEYIFYLKIVINKNAYHRNVLKYQKATNIMIAFFPQGK